MRLKKNTSLWLHFYFQIPCKLFIRKIDVQFTKWDIFIPFTSEGIFAKPVVVRYLLRGPVSAKQNEKTSKNAF